MIDFILKLFGYEIIYICDWGEYKTRYDSIDMHMGRPIHKNMSTCPPWGISKIVKIK